VEQAVARESKLRRALTLRATQPPLLRRLLGLFGLLLVLAAWWLLTLGATAESRVISPVVLPSPGEVVRSIPSLFTERAFIPSIAATLKRVLTGFGLAIIVGVPLGILAGAYRIFDAVTNPVSVFLRNIPVAVLIPLTILLVWHR
jgi:NitT/TauT family transport system permease protein